MQLEQREIVRTERNGGPVRSSHDTMPSALSERKPWLADALPRRFRDGLPLPPGVVEGVLASAAAPADPTAPETHATRAEGRRQRTYETPQSGGCLCGAIRFAVDGATPPKMVVACHCKTCQRSSGSGFLCWATMEAQDYHLLQGTPSAFEQAGGVRRFCGGCGTPLSFQRSDLLDEIDVALHAFDASPPPWEVELSIWTAHKREEVHLERLPEWKEDPARALSQGVNET